MTAAGDPMVERCAVILPALADEFDLASVALVWVGSQSTKSKSNGAEILHAIPDAMHELSESIMVRLLIQTARLAAKESKETPP